eukprot:s121_g27.t1
MSSLYSALTQGLQEVARKYRRILESMASTGCHIACCTVYRPNFKNTFLTGLSLCSLGSQSSLANQEMDSYMYQTVGSELVNSIAEAMELPLIRRSITGAPKNLENGSYVPQEGDEASRDSPVGSTS